MLARFHQIDNTLTEYQPYWRFEPFLYARTDRYPSWPEHASLCDWLQQLTPEQITELKSAPDKLTDTVSAFLPNDIAALTALSRVDVAADVTLPPRLACGIPGRKLQQILSLSAVALTSDIKPEWLEWCSGKGYLGRLLASESGSAVTSLEYQRSLCESGQREADKLGLPMRFVQADALADNATELMHNRQHAVALHACGDLHISLLQKAAQKRLAAITLSPCCYHLTRDSHYQPMSQAAKQSCLRLSKAELRIPLQETVTGGERVVRHRETEMIYRLGLDALLQQQLAISDYLPIPSIKKSQLALGFEHFCQWAAAEKGIVLADCDYQYYQQIGEQRFWLMERLSLVQQLFRRPLEIWLALDKCLFLQQQGYQVTLTEFCDREITPRNIVIQALAKKAAK
ncbi:methyltransferase [Vibrio sp.]|uniref:methyltransferase n=1 Tax=Vibrio sp. TaxID=678 RepID=UPI003D0C1325